MRSLTSTYTVLALATLALSLLAISVRISYAAEYYSPVALGPSSIAQNDTYVSPANVDASTTIDSSVPTNTVSNENPEMAVAQAAPATLGVGGWLAIIAVVLLIAGAGWLAWRASAENY